MIQQSPIMETAQNHLECDPGDDVSSADEAKLCNQISSVDVVIPEKNTSSNCLGTLDSSVISEINSAVISQKIPAESPSAFHDLSVNTTSEDGKVSDSCNDDAHKSNDLLMLGSNGPLNNAFEKEANEDTESFSNGEEMKVNTASFKLGFNNNAYQSENMSIENIEDENMGRMVYNAREPLSMIMEGNSPVTEVAPVAEVAPIIVVNHNQEIDSRESSTLDNTKKKVFLLKVEISYHNGWM